MSEVPSPDEVLKATEEAYLRIVEIEKRVMEALDE